MGAIVGTRRKVCDEEVTHLRPGALHEVEAHDPDATKLQVRAFLLQEANRGLKPCTRSTEPFALRRFYPFLNVEGTTTPTGRSWSTAFVTSPTLRLVGGVRDPWRRRTVP